MTDFSRLDQLTGWMTRVTDKIRALPPGDREGRARLSATWSRHQRARGLAVARLSSGGSDCTALARIGAHLDRVDPYRRGVPANRPVRQGRAAR